MSASDGTKTVCILAAGSGSRMGDHAGVIHKALLPVSGAGAISHLIAKFQALIGKDAHFVVAVGTQARDVRDYVELAHPGLSVEFVLVEKVSGPGSGPGASTLACLNHLQKPFYLACCDTLWEELLLPKAFAQRDWLAVAVPSGGCSGDYCNVRITENSRIAEFHNKRAVEGASFRAFTGVAHVQSHENFFRALKARGGGISGELELMHGFASLELFACEMLGWKDIGTYERYEAVVTGCSGLEFRKRGEFLYLVNGRVIKFFDDPDVVLHRVERAARFAGLVPKIAGARARFYAYEYVPGHSLHGSVTSAELTCQLAWLNERLWKRVQVPENEVGQRSLAFYRQKTLSRIDGFFSQAENACMDSERARAEALLRSVPWAQLVEAIPVVFHGDLQFDNIVVPERGEKFLLLDWRQDFAGSLAWGDLYYDFAKLQSCIDLDFHSADFGSGVAGADELRSVLYRFAEGCGLDTSRIALISALIYLNMAGLHKGKQSRILFLEGLGRLEKCSRSFPSPHQASLAGEAVF